MKVKMGVKKTMNELDLVDDSTKYDTQFRSASRLCIGVGKDLSPVKFYPLYSHDASPLSLFVAFHFGPVCCLSVSYLLHFTFGFLIIILSLSVSSQPTPSSTNCAHGLSAQRSTNFLSALKYP